MITSRYIKEILPRTEHPIWIIIQIIFVRGLMAIKFLLAARLLGPELIGLVGVALFSLAIVESLSDTGLSHAIIQRKEIINKFEAGGVWTLLLFRGLILSFFLFITAIPISIFFDISGAAELIAITAVIPLLRNAINPGFFLVQRKRDFRKISTYEIVAAIFDISVTMLLISLNFGAASLIIGNIACDTIKFFFTWTWFRIPISPNINWKSLQKLTSFGKWIWSSSLVTLVLNQTDKILVAKLLGPTEFGLYQVATRIAQIVVTDGAVALSQYLYPTFSQRYRSSPQDAKKYFNWIMWRLIPIIISIGIILAIFAEYIVNFFLGVAWLNAVPLLRALEFPMLLGAIISVLVVYLRAIGKPKFVTQATLVQLVFFLPITPVFLHYFGAIGMASSLAIAGSAAAYFMLYKISRYE